MAATAAKAPPPAKVSATVRRWMKTLTLREEVAQLVFIEFHGGSPNTRSRDYQKFVRLIRDTNVGGLILINAAKMCIRDRGWTEEGVLPCAACRVRTA